MQEELIEKNRLAAITQTVLTISHEVNNPLFIMQGNLELLETGNLPEDAKLKMEKIKAACTRISQATKKLSQLEKAETTVIQGEQMMIDLEKSR